MILSGYYLKCVLADNLAPFVDIVFQNPQSAHGFEIIVGVYAAAFRIYGDFAGYSRIAIGISKLMGIDLMTNFDRPYFAISPADFWRRWHISLSTWLRDYLYIPLGGNRRTGFLTYRNLMVTMLLGGLWHGAAWNFVAWGLFHGGILCIWRWVAERSERTAASTLKQEGDQSPLRILFFFHITCFGWILFFVKQLSDVPMLIANCVTDWQWNGSIGLLTIIAFASPVILMEATGRQSKQVHAVFSWSKPARLFVYAATTIAICLCAAGDQHEFIYFQF